MEVQSFERMVTKVDHGRLTRLAARMEAGASPSIQSLLDEIYVVPPPAIPASMITMYSQVLLQDDRKTEPRRITLSYPADADSSRGFISVLSPLGASLLELQPGDTARWRTPRGEDRSARVLQVLFQPEAHGDYTR